MNKVKLNINEKALQDVATKATNKLITEQGVEVKCPFCESTLIIHARENVCSNCGNTIIATNLENQ